MTNEKQRQKWREASKRYRERHPEKVRNINRENKRRQNLSPEFREKKNFSRRANGIGITKKRWEQMFDDQGRVCAICKLHNPGSSKGWHLDHCHKTKTIRFILCTHCNRGLGGFRDNPDLLRMAAQMLEEFNCNKLQDNDGLP